MKTVSYSKLHDFFGSFWDQVSEYLSEDDVDIFRYQLFMAGLTGLEKCLGNSSDEKKETNDDFACLFFRNVESKDTFSLMSTNYDLMNNTSSHIFKQNDSMLFEKTISTFSNQTIGKSSQQLSESQKGKLGQVKPNIKSKQFLLSKKPLEIKSEHPIKMLCNGLFAFDPKKFEALESFKSYLLDSIQGVKDIKKKGEAIDWKNKQDFAGLVNKVDFFEKFLSQLLRYSEEPMKFYIKCICDSNGVATDSKGLWQKLVKKSAKDDLYSSIILMFAGELLVNLHDLTGVSLSNICRDCPKFRCILSNLESFAKGLRKEIENDVLWKMGFKNFSFDQIFKSLEFYLRFLGLVEQRKGLNKRYNDFPVRMNLFHKKSKDKLEVIIKDFNEETKKSID